MPRPTNATRTTGHSAGLRYGLLGLPLAFAALPLYVHLPHLYASRYGMSLATLGLVLLAARLFDAVTDPWLGRLGDQLFRRSARAVLAAGAAAASVLVTGMVLLFFPPWDQPQEPARLLGVLALTSAGFSLLAIAHQSWGARLGGNEAERARIVAWREGAGLLGVLLASVLPTWLGWGPWLAVFVITLAAGWLAWARSAEPAPITTPDRPTASVVAAVAHRWQEDLLHPWRHAPFRRLMAVFICSGMASAVPATLVLFFVQDRLQAAAQAPLFLATYFVAAAVAMPLWLRIVARWGLARAWLAGMLLSTAVFAWAAVLSDGDLLGFWWVCVLSGLALGADLALPGAMLAGLIADRGDHGQREGSYFGWWNLASKLNLALAAGLALPLLELLGYQPGTTAATGLQALTLAYGVLPCVLKLAAATMLYLGFVRPARHPLHSNSPT